jgi:hypothetical protein
MAKSRSNRTRVTEFRTRKWALGSKSWLDHFGYCVRCGKDFWNYERGRPRLFCSSACRQAAYRDRRQGLT